nr:hypothetical protein BaRGS_000903 [Batillaria attramentaria]
MLPVFWSAIGSVKRLFAIVGVSRTPKVDDFVKAVFTTGRRQTETLYYTKAALKARVAIFLPPLMPGTARRSISLWSSPLPLVLRTVTISGDTSAELKAPP